MTRTLCIALFVAAASSFAMAQPCDVDPAGFRAAIVGRLPLSAKPGDLTEVRACKTRLAVTRPRFATCIARVENFLAYEFENPLGTTPGGEAIHAEKASFPPALRDASLFQALDEAVLGKPASLNQVKTALAAINKRSDTDWVMASFAGHVDSVGTVPFGELGEMTSYGRILMYSAAKATWANFVISMSDKGVGDKPVNVSILKVADGATYFQDHTRHTSGLSVVRAGGTGNGIKCGQCHATGFLKAYPQPSLPISGTAYAVDAPALAAVNAVGTNKAPFANHMVLVFGGVTVGDATGAKCGDDELLKSAARCGTCHKDGGVRGPLYLGSMSRDVIDRYVTASSGHGGGSSGHMPPSASDPSIWTEGKRARLYACLKDDFEARFRTWLAVEPCT